MTRTMRRVPVRFDDLSLALDFVSMHVGIECAAFISRSNGEIYLYGDDIPEENPPLEEIEDDPAYLAVPDKRDLDLGLSWSAASPPTISVPRGGKSTASSAVAAPMDASRTSWPNVGCWNAGTNTNSRPPKRHCGRGARSMGSSW
jgi:hypothetical protein